MPQDMIELQSVERNSEIGRKVCLEVNLHPISFLHKWVSELTGREYQGTPLSTSDEEELHLASNRGVRPCIHLPRALICSG